MYVANLEMHYPLTGPERLSRIKSRFLLTKLNLFTDTGIARGNYQGFSTGDKGQHQFRESKAAVSTGLSLRINLFGYLILDPFYTVPWQNGGFRNANFGLNFIPNW